MHVKEVEARQTAYLLQGYILDAYVRKISLDSHFAAEEFFKLAVMASISLLICNAQCGYAS